MRRERRQAPRIPVNSPTSVAYPGAEDAQATIVDLSDGGTSVRSGSTLPPECKVYFQFALPGQQQAVRLSGEVAWQDASGRTGIRFVDVPQASRRLMHAWLLQNSFRQGQDQPPRRPSHLCSAWTPRPKLEQKMPALALIAAESAASHANWERKSTD